MTGPEDGQIDPKNVSSADESEAGEQTADQSTFHHDTTEAKWELLSQQLEAFCARWEVDGFGPPLQEFIKSDDIKTRRLMLIELIKVDLENRYALEAAILSLEDYLEEHPELGQPDGMPAELIYEEFHLKEAAELHPQINDCLCRFPDKAGELLQLLRVDDPDETQLTGSSFAETFEIGDHIDDFYLMSALGTGAFGSVFLARQESMQRLVALKVSSDKGSEGQTLAQLDHPNIVRVYDQVRLPEQKLRLLYMQFAAGGTLQAVIRKARTAEHKTGQIIADCIADALNYTGVIPADNVSLTSGLNRKPWPEVVCHMGRELSLALHYAHQQGILHRDVKPANVLLAANGTPKLADFNISFSSELEGQNAVAYFGGSLSYMSPEQLKAFHPGKATKPEDLDARSDVYSLAVMLWELLFGERPFDDQKVTTDDLKSSLDGMLRLREADGRLTAAVPKTDDPVHSHLSLILRKCLSPAPADRYESAAEVARELGWCRHPRVAAILSSSTTGLRRMAIARPLAAFLLAALSPHVIAAIFNFFYNETWVKARLSNDAFSAFHMMVIAVNVVAFPLGFALCIWFSRRVIAGLQQKKQGDFCQNHSAFKAGRQDCLKLPQLVTAIGVSEWVVAGLVYPVGLHLVAGPLLLRWHIHFFSSLLICGLIAAAYPFYLSTSLCVRAFLPNLLKRTTLQQSDLHLLTRLSDQSVISLYLAGGVPAAGMLFLLLTQDAQDQLSNTALKLLSVLGALGFAWLLSAARSLQADIDAFHTVGEQMIRQQEQL
ncbi:MAG: serine/threonine-protein kinase [Fuerstiella sp.]